jgi:hypothetical protein
LRGRFPRAAGNGHGFGAAESDAIRNIAGYFQFRSHPSANTYGAIGGDFSALFDRACKNGSILGSSLATSTNSFPDTLYFDASRVVPVAAENRPCNVALFGAIHI